MNTVLRILKGIFIAFIAVWLLLAAAGLIYLCTKYFFSVVTIIIVIGSIAALVHVLPKTDNGTSWLWLILGIIGLSQIDADREASNDEDDFIRSKWQ